MQVAIAERFAAAAALHALVLPGDAFAAFRGGACRVWIVAEAWDDWRVGTLQVGLESPQQIRQRRRYLRRFDRFAQHQKNFRTFCPAHGGPNRDRVDRHPRPPGQKRQARLQRPNRTRRAQLALGKDDDEFASPQPPQHLAQFGRRDGPDAAKKRELPQRFGQDEAAERTFQPLTDGPRQIQIPPGMVIRRQQYPARRQRVPLPLCIDAVQPAPQRPADEVGQRPADNRGETHPETGD